MIKGKGGTRMELKDQIISAIRYREIIRLLNTSFPYEYALIKGEALSILAYGCEGKRHLGDVDLLVTKDTVSELIRVLEEHGYTPVDNEREGQVSALLYSHQSTPYVKYGPWGRLEIDINFEIVWGEWKYEKPKVKEMLSRRQPIRIYGESTYSLEPTDTLIYGCLNLYREINSTYHLWSHNPIKTERFMELDNLFRLHKSVISIERVREWGIKNHLWPMILSILQKVGTVSEDKELIHIIENLGLNNENETDDLFGLGERKYSWPISFEERLDNERIPEIIEPILDISEKNKIMYQRTVYGGTICDGNPIRESN